MRRSYAWLARVVGTTGGPPSDPLGGPDPVYSSVGTPIRTSVAVGSILTLHTGLAGVGDILGAVPLEDFLRALHLVAVFGVYGEEDVPALHLALVSLGFDLRHSVADQRARDAARRASCGRPAQQAHDRAGRDQRSH